jgi:glycosyltransferase involved in cell wall biosynthesis
MDVLRNAHRKRVCIVATVPFALKWFMTPHIILLRDRCDLTLVANDSSEGLEELLGGSVSYVQMPIMRKISIKDDIFSLMKLWQFFRKEKFDCVYSIMPKAGFLSMLASFFAGIPTRLCVFNGEVWANKIGLKRSFLKFLDKITARFATVVLAVGPSQRKVLIKNNIIKEDKVNVIADGSIAGVNLDRFKLNNSVRHQIRLQNKIETDAIVFLFVGRLARDKGLLDLFRAFSKAAEQNPNIHLMIVGPDEAGLDKVISSALANRFAGRVHRFGFTDYPENYMSAADVLCLPSYREGLSTALIEAASMGLPTIASRIYGVTDVVVEGITGILHKPAAEHEIVAAMLSIANNEKLRQKMGAAARLRAVDMFSEERVMKAFSQFYNEMFLELDKVVEYKKPKLLFVVTEDWYFVSHRLSLAVAARKMGYEVAVVTRIKNHAEIIKEAGIRLIPFKLSRRIGNPLTELLGLFSVYRREHPDIVHHVAMKPIFLGTIAAGLAGFPIQVNAVAGLGWLFISQSPIARWLNPLIRWILFRLLSASRGRVIVQNPDDAELLKKAGVKGSNMLMIRGAGVDTLEFSFSPVPPEPICVVLASRILWDKGVGEFVDAARQLIQDGVEARFILVGDPDPDNPTSIPEKILSAWQKEKIIEWWGHRDDMVTVFQAAHIVCLPSYREGLPKVLLEAAACGRPIVTTDVPGCREVVREGENGLLVPAHNAQALSEALLCLIKNHELRAQMGRRSREIMLKDFSSEKVIAQTLSVYKELIE